MNRPQIVIVIITIGALITLLTLGACTSGRYGYAPASPADRYARSDQDVDARPVIQPAVPGLEGEALRGKDALAAADTAPGDRDLGKGADREPLGGRGETYASINDNPFVRVAAQDSSTFAIDVDTASYSNVRRFLIQERRLPPADAVRIEELLNALPYSYAPPAVGAEHPFRVHSALAACPWQPAHRIARIALKGREVSRAARPAANLVFLVDVSGSMDEPAKLPLVKRSLKLLAEQLDERDTISLVTYAGQAGVMLDSTPGHRYRVIANAIDRLGAGGSTAGADGIRTAYALARRTSRDGVASRVILCTDGDFNVGVSDPRELKKLIVEEARSGVFLNVYGFGTGNLQDHTMETLADHGNGIYAYIDSAEQAKRVVGDDLLGQLVTIARDVKVQVWFNPAEVAAWRLIGYENRRLRREDFSDDRVDAGDLGAGHSVTALYELVPSGAAMPVDDGVNPFTAVRAPAAGAVAEPGTALEVRLRWQPPGGGTSTLAVTRLRSHLVDADADLRFACAVAGFGMLLRDSPHRGDLDWARVLALAEGARGEDSQGRRAEFIRLVAAARRLDRRDLRVERGQ